MKIYTVRKKIGETPLTALQRLIRQKKLPPQSKYSYAGRLDPMAEGLLLILADATQAERENMLQVRKVYEAEILFGLKTDTADLLGMPEQRKPAPFTKMRVQDAVKKLVPSVNLPIPVFSSVQVSGKSGFVHARAGRSVVMPYRNMEVFRVENISHTQVYQRSVLKRIIGRVSKVQGDFRQEMILRAWSKMLIQPNTKYTVVRFRIHCGSGTYIRSIAEYLGNRLNSPALVYGLKRTAVGKHKLP